ncbi:hypothetical protein [Cereibacter sediminicola]|nr:hypothetical protein [Cereibacter sediminicola]
MRMQMETVVAGAVGGSADKRRAAGQLRMIRIGGGKPAENPDAS